MFIKLLPADEARLSVAFDKQVPPGLIAKPFLGDDRPNWNIVLKAESGGLYALDLEGVEKRIGPFTIHALSNYAAKNPADVALWGLVSFGMFENEQKHLMMLYERKGGGTGAVHFALHPELGLLIGLQPDKRNRKHALDGWALPRGYDTNTVAGIHSRLEEARLTAIEETLEEAIGFKYMVPFALTWNDGLPFRTDQNGSVMCSGSGEGFQYQAVQWPMELLIPSAIEGVWEPDTSNPIVSTGSGDKEAGHTGTLYFVPFDQMYNHSLLPNWDPAISADGLGYTGAPALRAMLKREGIYVG